MAGKSKVVDRDLGYKAFKALIFEAPKKSVVVGLLQGEIATYAAANEYGTATIPSRPFLRTTIDENAQVIGNEWNRQMGRLIAAKITDPTPACIAVGTKVVNLVKAKIRSGMPPPNAPATVAAKGEDTPLVDTGQMQRAVTFEVRPRGGGSK